VPISKIEVKNPPTQTEGPDVPAVSKTIAIVRFLNSRPSAGATLAQIVEQLAITRSHCHNILRTLVAYGWIDYSSTARLYRLSSGIAADSSTALYARTQLAVVRPFADKLFDQIDLQCFLSEPLADGSFLIIHSSDETDAYLFRAPVGYRFPPGTAALFKAKLAWLPAVEVDVALSRWVPVQHSRNSIMDRATMRAELLNSRQRGFALSLGEYIEGFNTVALPIFDREGNIMLILGISGIEIDFNRKEREIVSALIGTAASIHLIIDGRPPVDYPSPKNSSV
jgi:DNA-binding IclR family transcriptional regulator